MTSRQTSSAHHSRQVLLPAITGVLTFIAGAVAQSGDKPSSPPPRDWRLPYRTFEKPIDPPPAAYSALSTMLRIRDNAQPHQVRFDDEGREVVDDPNWLKAREELESEFLDAGLLSIVLRKSTVYADRRIAFYGMYYVSSPQTVFAMIGHIPGEPAQRLRTEALPRAIEFLRVHLPSKVDGDLAEWNKIKVGPAAQKPPRPGTFSYTFDPFPFHAMLEVDEPFAQAQSLYLLASIVEARPIAADGILDGAQHRVPALLCSEDSEVARLAYDLVRLCDPSEQEPPPRDAEAKTLLDWFDGVIYRVFPPIRPISSGLIEVWPSKDRDQIAEVGAQALREGTLGAATHGKTNDGAHYSGFRIDHLPEPLDLLTIETGSVITSIDGNATTTAEDVLNALKIAIEAGKKKLFVQLVHHGRPLAMQFHLL